MEEDLSGTTFDLESGQSELLLKDREVKERLLQYNLDKTLLISKFRIIGKINVSTLETAEMVVRDFFASHNVAFVGGSGSASLPFKANLIPLNMNIVNMDFFERLSEVGIVGPGGKIRGCFDEVYDGITVGDLLREFLLNEDSENASAFTDSEKRELIFQVFRLIAVGGGLCQPDDDIEKYLMVTKKVYKELVTVYRAENSTEIQVSGKAFLVKSVDGVELFPENPDSPHNVMIVIIDPMKKLLTVVKNTFTNFW